MPKIKNIEKIAQVLGGTIDFYGDGSGSWVHLEDANFSIDIEFDGKGENFKKINVAKKIYQVVDEKIIASINNH